MTVHDVPTAAAPVAGGLTVELNGINVIAEKERKGTPRSLFWPWCAANVSVLGVPYGAFVLGFGVSLWQASVAGLVGIIASFLLVGFVSLAGKRGSAPTMVLSRGAFGVRGNAGPTALSWVLLVGWEIVLVSLASLAAATVTHRLFPHLGNGTGVKVLALVVVLALVAGGGILGFDVIMRMQTVITVATAVLTVGYIALTVSHIHWHTVTALPSGSFQHVVGATVFVVTGFGLGWVNTAADYSRYLPRNSSGPAVVGWTTFGASVAPVILLGYGLLLAGSSSALSAAIGADPIGALTTILPTWYLLPFLLVAILGLVGGAVLDIYSSGLALLTLGLPVRRPVAAGVDAVLMVIGTVYVVFFASSFVLVFEAFLVTLGVPIAAWCGIFLADMVLRRRPFADAELYDARGRYGWVTWPAVLVLVVATAVGWGLVTNSDPSAGWLSCQGYLLGPVGLGGKTGSWEFANLGVLVAIVLGFVGWLIAGRRTVARQESAPDLVLAN